MTRTIKHLLTAAFVLITAFAVSSPAHAQPGYGQQGRITCSSDNGRRNWCDIGRARDAQIVRQISGAACIQDRTWGIDNRGLWVDKGCRADFVIGRAPGPPQAPSGQTINCSSNDGRRNWCDIGRARDAQLVRQISGAACIQGRTWGIDGRGLWVDSGCRADFAIGRGGGYGPPQAPPPQVVTCSSNDGRRNWCDVGGRRDIRFSRQISGAACIQDRTWGTDRRGIWVDGGCRAEFFVR